MADVYVAGAGVLILTGLVLVAIARLSRKAAATAALTAAILGLWAFWIEPRSLVVATHTVPVAGLTAPVRAVVIGDPQPTAFHWPVERLRQAFARAQAQDPDIMLWLGDYAYEGGLYDRLDIEDAVFVDPADIVEAMAQITAPMGAYAILGNHDWWWNGPEVARLIRGTHVRLLLDEAVQAIHPDTGAALWIAGLEDMATPRPVDVARALAQTDGTAPVIVLSHTPDIFPRIPSGPALTLAGHTHCGQVRVPFFGRPVVPIHHDEYACGLIEEGDRRLWVTAGIGTAILPVRFLTPPEILVLDLVPAGADGLD